MENKSPRSVTWQRTTVNNPEMHSDVSVIAARDIPYVEESWRHRLRTLTVYLPDTSLNARFIGTLATSLPESSTTSSSPRFLVHIHGGAWRDPFLSSLSIEAAVAHAFSRTDQPIEAIISINYTLSPFPGHAVAPYSPWKENNPSDLQVQESERDVAREARHPEHIRDVLRAFEMLRTFNLEDDDFVLSGHSCGACIAFQTFLQPPSHWGLGDIPSPPRPKALIGLNGLYDLPGLVYELNSSHAHLSDVYRDLQSIAFGSDEVVWARVSPARFDSKDLQRRLKGGRGSIPGLILVDQSSEDQLVPLNQMTRMRETLEEVGGVHVVFGSRCAGEHAAPWKEGWMLWETVVDVLELLKSSE